MPKQNIIIFTDLDGCLLDHYDYSFSAALPLISHLKQFGIPLIINSSKTKLEIAHIQEDMGIDTPFIIENGAAIIFNSDRKNCLFNINNSDLELLEGQLIKKFAIPRGELLTITNKIKNKHHFKYKGFSDMSLSQISGLTQLSEEMAFAASQRLFSEPVYWQDSQDRLAQFKQLLSLHNINLQQGGRFVHLSSKYSKGQAMQWLLEHNSETSSSASTNKHTTIISLGDSMNDVSMLKRSDYALIIKNNGNKLDVQGKKQTIRSSLSGTSGWIETLTPLINQLVKS